MSKPPLPNSIANRNQAGIAPTGVSRTHEKGSILDASNMSITIGDGKNKVLSEKFSELSNSSVPRVSRQRSNPIAIRRKRTVNLRKIFGYLSPCQPHVHPLLAQ